MIKVNIQQRAIIIKALKEARANWNAQASQARSSGASDAASVLANEAIHARDLAAAIEEEVT